jgi:hypothetical protein
MVRMHCKSLILQHPLTKCHIITSREMQKIKMNTDTTNQNKYNTKNTLASRPNKLKKRKRKKQTQQTHAGHGSGKTHSGRGSGEHADRGYGETHAGRGLAGQVSTPADWLGSRRAKLTHSAHRNPPTAKSHPRRKPTHNARRNPPTSKPHPRQTHSETHPQTRRNQPTSKPTAKPHPRRKLPTAWVSWVSAISRMVSACTKGLAKFTAWVFVF